jgi:energy-coupling factor transporter ATP-binding protein EcfA2
MGAPATALYAGRIYPGLRPFDVEDALLFFGREEQTDELLRRIDDTRFVAVVGLSGSGKSSLVRAGLLPALRRGHLTGAGSRWQLSVMRPGSDPLDALARALNEALGQRDDRLAMLRSGRFGLLDTSRQGRNADENLLLVVDQFEEIFRFQDSYRRRTGEAAEFIELLLAASQEYEPAYRVYVVMTLRSDYLGECARFRGLSEALNESQYLVPRMARERLREAIDGPAALGGVALSKELREELLDKTGDDPDQLPVMQHLLMRMWEIRKPADTGFSIGREQYKAVGG